ncbi:hypothetical protein PR202_gb26235 [Eleusine coracana subsp. coracana]|uniref:Uncharacterized protein n=1 Tax=Eleusine coracana subsp. coracana TaxID=191504 RepID=A0AAV5FNJ6_ELECO|nr:hypothetical protein PR202_gb26235 [Eleusine coracana subsp. coracana]
MIVPFLVLTVGSRLLLHQGLKSSTLGYIKSTISHAQSFLMQSEIQFDIFSLALVPSVPQLNLAR